MTLDSGVTVTTLGGPAAYRILSADSMCIKCGLVIVLTPPISGRVTTCFGPHGGPCLAAALPDSAGGGAARHGSSPRGAGSPFRILTPALGFADRGGMALCVNVENAVTTIAHSYDGRVDFQALRNRAHGVRPCTWTAAVGCTRIGGRTANKWCSSLRKARCPRRWQGACRR